MVAPRAPSGVSVLIRLGSQVFVVGFRHHGYSVLVVFWPVDDDLGAFRSTLERSRWPTAAGHPIEGRHHYGNEQFRYYFSFRRSFVSPPRELQEWITDGCKGRDSKYM